MLMLVVIHCLCSPALLRAFEMMGPIDIEKFVQAENHLILNFFTAVERGCVRHTHSNIQLPPASDARTVHLHCDIILRDYFGEMAHAVGGDVGVHTGTLTTSLLPTSQFVKIPDEEGNVGELEGVCDDSIVLTAGVVDPISAQQSQDFSKLRKFVKDVLVDESCLPHGSARLSDFSFVS